MCTWIVVSTGSRGHILHSLSLRTRLSRSLLPSGGPYAADFFVWELVTMLYGKDVHTASSTAEPSVCANHSSLQCSQSCTYIRSVLQRSLLVLWPSYGLHNHHGHNIRRASCLHVF